MKLFKRKPKAEKPENAEALDSWHFDMQDIIIVGPTGLKAPEMIETLYRRLEKRGVIV